MCEKNDDEELAIRMMCGDKEALREVLKRHLEPVRGVLAGIYGTTVQQGDIDEAVNRAIYKMWRTADTYNKNKGTLGAWFYTMAQSAVLDIFRREKRHRRKYPLLDQEFDAAEQCDDPESDEPLTKVEKKELKDLDHVIEHKLKGHQKAIIKADLAVGGTADAGSLAEMLNTTKESIYVSRHKGHENIRKEMTQLAQDRERLRGKK
jgi:RNA polymerase sigma factor (sigma-70 family)